MQINHNHVLRWNTLRKWHDPAKNVMYPEETQIVYFLNRGQKIYFIFYAQGLSSLTKYLPKWTQTKT